MVDITIYHAAKTHNPCVALKHFGVLDASIGRVVSLFTGDMDYRINAQGQFLYKPFKDSPVTQLSSDEFIDNFCDAMELYSIKEFVLIENKSLQLIDEWLDDPLGSGGMSIFNKEVLSDDEYRQLWGIFAPFDKPIYPNMLHFKYSKSDIKKIIQDLKKSDLGKQELAGRKKRAIYFNEDFSETKYQEAVWLDLTLKVRKWAMSNGYGYATYTNNQEGSRNKSYVIFDNDVVTSSGKTLYFSRKKYMEIIAPIFKGVVGKFHAQYRGGGVHVDRLLWADLNPMDYWDER